MFPLITGKLTFIFGDLITAPYQLSSFLAGADLYQNDSSMSNAHQLFANRH
jgi:hypothetical protein